MRNKSITNIIYAIISQSMILLLGLIVPRIIIVNYGSDTNGVTNTITQVFTYLALLEAGIGQSTRNALFPYLKNGIPDKSNISKIMSVSRRYYRSISVLYALAVIVLALLLPIALKSSLGYSTIFSLVLLEGASGVVSFYFIQNWTTLLAADGHRYVVSNIELFNKVLCYGIKICLAINGYNIVVIQLGFFVASLLKLLLYKLYMERHYSWIKYEKVEKSIKLNDRNAYIVTEIAWTIFSSTDLIVLSVFCSSELASVYSVYNMVFVAINSIVNAVYSGISFNLGQTYHSNSATYIRLHDCYNSIFLGIMTALMCTAYTLIIPFVKLYTVGVEDINYIYYGLPVLFCVVQLLSWSRNIAGNLSGLAGYAKKVSYVSLIEAIINIVASVILVKRFQIMGVLFATVLALPVKVVYLNYLADRVILKRKITKTVSILIANYLLFCLSIFANHFINLTITTYSEFLLLGLGITMLFASLSFFINVVVNRNVLNLIHIRRSNK